MNIPQLLQNRLAKLNATYRLQCAVRGNFPNQTSVQVCEIIDLTTNRVYATGEHAEKVKAIDAAVTVAENTSKPLTPAQMADPLLAKQIASVAESEEKVQTLQSENDELKARIAALEASRGESQGSESPNEQFSEPAEIAEPEEIPDPAKPKGKGGSKTKAG